MLGTILLWYKPDFGSTSLQTDEMRGNKQREILLTHEDTASSCIEFDVSILGLQKGVR